MRLWSLHPHYLDAKGLVALWREGLLARSVLEGRTQGYRNHPQLERFKAQGDPVATLNSYLLAVYEEGLARGYCFDRSKIGPCFSQTKMEVTTGQLRYEFAHLLRKLQRRDEGRYRALLSVEGLPEPHPLFYIVEGEVASWERPSRD